MVLNLGLIWSEMWFIKPWDGFGQFGIVFSYEGK